MNRLIVATSNEHKIKEIREILGDLPFIILGLKEMNIDVEINENGTTFEENAYIKAHEIAGLTGETVLADDSGLEVDALGGAPGVLSARFAGIHGDDRANNEKLLELMADIPDCRRGGRFTCAMVLLYPDGRSVVSRGEVNGYIAHRPEGSGGFGYDPVFIVPEYGKTFAELGSSIKNSIGHRGRALRGLRDKLLKDYQGGEVFEDRDSQ
jgi:XTP/dITP diphosphohydrolase